MESSRTSYLVIRRTTPLLGLALLAGLARSAVAGCPPGPVIQRSTTDAPYTSVFDLLVTGTNVLPDSAGGRSASISATDYAGDGQFLLAFESSPSYSSQTEDNGIYVMRFFEIIAGSSVPCNCPDGPTFFDDCPLRLDLPTEGVHHNRVSIAVNRGDVEVNNPAGNFFASWVAATDEGEDSVVLLPRAYEISPYFLLNGEFTETFFGQIATPSTGTEDRDPSSGLSALDEHYSLTNSMRTGAERGLIRQIQNTGAVSASDQIRCCGVSPTLCPGETCSVQVGIWKPSIMARNDGIHVVAWAEHEEANALSSPFNIALRLYAADGSLIDGLDRGETIAEFKSVNEPDREILSSDQISPAVDIDDCGNIVVVWVGRAPLGPKFDPTQCQIDENTPRYAVYARRLYYNSSNGGFLEFQSDQFVVNSDIDWGLGSAPEEVHPTVAVIRSERFEEVGNFIVGWNAELSNGQKGARAQYFRAHGQTRGAEFDLTPNPPPNDPDGIDRTLAESSQHTLVYTRDDHHVVAAWTQDNGSREDVWWTFILTDPFLQDWEVISGQCEKGDMDADGNVVDADIAPFVTTLLATGDAPCDSYIEICPADTNFDGVANGLDVQCFVNLLLGYPLCSTGEEALAIDCFNNPGEPESEDCNDNDIADSKDIRDGTSEDCNNNGIPDECDIAAESSSDVNSNDMPDECETDCNNNDIPDAWDISQESSADVNGNDIPDDCEPDCNGNEVPDDWEINEEEAKDCNENGIPDECEYDCNGNEVPDDCDIANATSEDCNENEVPDECDLSRSVLPSFDCNENEIPDECDIASAYSQDANENDIPDECEGEGFMGGGGGAPEGGGEGGEFDPDAAWGAFWEWYGDALVNGVNGTAWAELSHAQQFDAIMEKLVEVGLPYARPW